MKTSSAIATLEPAEPITEFEVCDGGTLRMADFHEAETRADFYEDVADSWSDSPDDLIDAMEECRPLAWTVESIYLEFRGELESDLQDAESAGKRRKHRLKHLKARLKALATNGASTWILSMTRTESGNQVVPEVEKWFGEPPDWGSEDEYLLESGTAQGAALVFFRDMASDQLKILGVKVVEGEHPGSTYYAAELRSSIEEANRAAEAAGIAVRFVAAKDELA
jgi:hypothetical protein